MEDVLSLYTRDFSSSEVLVCLDETSKQMVGEIYESLPSRPGDIKKVDHEYKRNGTTSIFMLSAPLEGKRYVRVTGQRTRKEYSEVLRELSDEIYPDRDKIILVQDNLNTHEPSSLYSRFEPGEAKRLADRFEFHYTPKHGSWLNIAEIELSVLSRQCMNSFFDNCAELEAEINSWEKERNSQDKKIDWRFTTDDARVKLKRLYPTL